MDEVFVQEAVRHRDEHRSAAHLVAHKLASTGLVGKGILKLGQEQDSALNKYDAVIKKAKNHLNRNKIAYWNFAIKETPKAIKEATKTEKVINIEISDGALAPVESVPNNL